LYAARGLSQVTSSSSLRLWSLQCLQRHLLEQVAWRIVGQGKPSGTRDTPVLIWELNVEPKKFEDMVRQNCCIRTVRPPRHQIPSSLSPQIRVCESNHIRTPQTILPRVDVSQTLPLSDSVSTLPITDRKSGSPTVGVFTTFLVLVRLVAHTYFIRQG
jgi:hypothetical protein